MLYLTYYRGEYMALLLFFATIPIIIIMLYVYSKDKNKEPLALLIKLFLSGFLSCYLVLIVSDLLGMVFPFMEETNRSVFGTFLYAFIGVALVEELCKWIMVMLIGYNHNAFDEIYDILIYAVFVSLGFAFIENVMYVINLNSLRTAMVRAVSAVPSHACDAVFMGYFLSIAKQNELNKKNKYVSKYIILSIVTPTILHGTYDFLLMSGIEWSTEIFFVFVVVLYFISIKRLKKLSKLNRQVVKRTRFCKKCGKPINTPICPYCGNVHINKKLRK